MSDSNLEHGTLPTDDHLIHRLCNNYILSRAQQTKTEISFSYSSLLVSACKLYVVVT
jgi:hypothetical protein